MIKRVAMTLSGCCFASAALAHEPGVVLPDLTVSAGRVEQVQGQTIAPISVIDRETLDQRQARSLDDVLQEIPGVTASSGPRRDALQPTLRGLSDGRVVVRIDGARQNLQINHRGQTFFDPALLQRVEVLRGPASTLYGSGAIGGVVDLRTLDADALLASGAVHGGRVFSGYQSNADERVLGATLATRQRGFGLLGSLSTAQANDYQDGNGERIAFSGSDSESALLKATWAAGEASNFSASYLSFDDESLSRVTADRPRGDVIVRDIQQRTGSLRYTFQPLGSALWDLDVSAYRTTVDMDEQPEDPTRPSIVNELQTTGLDLFNTSRAVTGPMAHQLTYGIELYRDEQVGLENGQPRPQFENAEQAVMGAFIQDRIALIERAALTVGARVDRIKLSAERQGLESIRYTEVSPQATLSVVLTDRLDAYLSYAEAFRAPSLRELYVGGQHFPGNTFVPNPDLDPERAHNLEAGLLWSRSGVWNTADRVHGQLSVYRNDIDDFIEQIVRGDGDPAMPNTTRFENVTEARLEGIELELRYDHPRYRAALIGSRVRGDDRTQGDPLAAIPADEITLLAAWRAVEGMEIGGRGRHAATQDRLPLTTDPDAAGVAPSHAVADLFASWQLGSALRLDARIDNLFDRQYRRAVNLVPNPGRNLRLQIGYDF
ncbi:TonB-dependent receptor domain-containing protein [Polycyclovorans algicola]|uniref:TonB-dependent receptor domain-containing protein n=1 Tax=Polycyclovorans algicola TaxID=616992 RepID=UPI00069364D0|nr:TonB-dependent receptor [Polycyclovorans algicola]